MASYKDEDTLRALYHDKGLSLPEIGERFDIDASTVHYWMEKFDIPRRKSGDKRPPSVQQSSGGYLIVASESNGEVDVARVHRLVAVAEYGIDVVKGNDVHHKNGIPWDNRPCNLEVMTRSEHMTHHMSDPKRKEKLKEWGRKGAFAKQEAER